MKLEIATPESLNDIESLVADYHHFESIQTSHINRITALKPLLEASSGFGCIYQILRGEDLAGYIALSFGYSIEYGGPEVSIDEFFIKPRFRRQGMGNRVVSNLKYMLSKQGFKRINLIVAKDNKTAIRLYEIHGFKQNRNYLDLFCDLGSDAAVSA